MDTEKRLHEDLGVLWRCLSSHIPLTVHLRMDGKDMQIREHVHKIETLEETCLDPKTPSISSGNSLCRGPSTRSFHHLKYSCFWL